MRFLIGVVIFDGYDLLDIHGPIRLLLSPILRAEGGRDSGVVLISEDGDPVKAAQHGVTTHADSSFRTCPKLDALFIPGGIGTRREVKNDKMMTFLKAHVPKVNHVLVVCTGSGLLAATGLLDGKHATSNKAAFEWAKSQGEKVDWVRKARWIQCDKFFTSSGGMDMVLGFIRMLYGEETAWFVANAEQYEWNSDPNSDPFADLYPPHAISAVAARHV